MTNEQTLFAVRDWDKNKDIDFIMATWLRGLRYGNDWFGMIVASSYFSFYQQFIEQLLKNPNVSVKIACLQDDPEVILGYSVYHKNILHWVFTKKAWRKIGIAKKLVPIETSTVTHLTAIGKSIMQKKTKWQFNPFLTN